MTARDPADPDLARKHAEHCEQPTTPEEHAMPEDTDTAWAVSYGPDRIEEADDRFDAYRWAEAGDGQVVRRTGDGPWGEDRP